MKKRMMSVSEAARMMGRAGRGDCKRRQVDYRKLARMAGSRLCDPCNEGRK